MAAYSLVKTVSTGDTITAVDRNNEHQNHINNNTCPGVVGDSANTAGMQVTVDPYPSSVESLATTLQGEIERLRYVLKGVTGKAQWYIPSDESIVTLFTLTTNLAPVAATATSTTIIQRIQMVFSQIKTGFGLTNWYDPITRKGQVLQKSEANSTSNVSSSSTTFVDVTNLTTTLTPAATGNMIKVRVTLACLASNSAGGKACLDAQIVRGSSTVVRVFNNVLALGGATTTAGNVWAMVTLVAEDLPATTSATSYKVQIRNNAGGAVAANDTTFATTTSWITCEEIGQ